VNQIEIHVVDHDGEKLFKTGELLFDQMLAEKEFEGGKLTITRSGQILDETEEISYYGTHGATTCFVGLRKFFPENNFEVHTKASLVPDEFKVGDVLILEINQEGDYAQHLRTLSAFHSALIGTLSENPDGITLGELDKKLPSVLKEEMQTTKRAEIVRFLPKIE